MREGAVHSDLLGREIARVLLCQEEVLTPSLHGGVKLVWSAVNSPVISIAVAVIVNTQESVS